MFKRFLSCCLALWMIVAQVHVFAEEMEIGDFKVISDNRCTFVDGALKITEEGNYVISNKFSEVSAANKLEITAKSGIVNLTLQNVKINSSVPFVISGGCDVNLNLAGENILTAGFGHAGLQKDGNGKLMIQGEGKLVTKGGSNGAGIGGGIYKGAKNINVCSGKILAIGGAKAAGIGGGHQGCGSGIVVEGGEIEAIGGANGAGIGGGSEADGVNISLRGGKVIARGGDYGAGIGGGFLGNGENITISGGIVSAIGNFDAVLGGESSLRKEGCIPIIGEILGAIGDFEGELDMGGAGIGGGDGGKGRNIIISGGDVEVFGLRAFSTMPKFIDCKSFHVFYGENKDEVPIADVDFEVVKKIHIIAE